MKYEKGFGTELLVGVDKALLNHVSFDFIESELDPRKDIPLIMRHIDFLFGIALEEKEVNGIQLAHSLDSLAVVLLKHFDI